MQSHLLVRTVRWRIRPHLDLELVTIRSWHVGRRRGRCGRTESVFLEYPRRGSHTIALLEVFSGDDASFVEHERAGVRHATLLVTRLDPVKRVLLDEVLLVQQPERTDGVAALIGQERGADATLFSERGQHLPTVLTDPEH